MANITTFNVPSLTRPEAVEAIFNSVRPMPGVTDVTINLPVRLVNVEYDPTATNADALKDAIERAGYRVQRYSDGRR